MKFSGVSAAALSTFMLCASAVTAQDYPQQAHSAPIYAPPISPSVSPQHITPQYYPQTVTPPAHQSELPPVTQVAPTVEIPAITASPPAYYSASPAPVHSYAPPAQVQPYAPQPGISPVHVQPYAHQVHAAPAYAQPYAPPAQFTTYSVAHPHTYAFAVVPAPATASPPPVRKLSKREREDSVKRCNFADDSIGHALNSYSQLLHKQLPYDSAKHYENQMHAQTYNLRNHIRSIKHSGHSEVCEYESNMALQIIHTIYQYK